MQTKHDNDNADEDGRANDTVHEQRTLKQQHERTRTCKRQTNMQTTTHKRKRIRKRTCERKQRGQLNRTRYREQHRHLKFSATRSTKVLIPFTTDSNGEVAIMFYAVTPVDAWIDNVKVY